MPRYNEKKPLCRCKKNASQASNINVKTRSTSYIYFSPMSLEERTVYIAIKNDADNVDFNLRPWLVQSLEQKSFRVVDHIDEANIVLRANLLRVGKVNPNDIEELLDSEFGNSTQILSPALEQDKHQYDGVVIDLQYFARKHLRQAHQNIPRLSMEHLSDVQLLLICNSAQWERFQARIVAIAMDRSSSHEKVYAALGEAITQANTGMIKP
ncbi:MAG: complement resistance protein TraT [Gammaproteobacteria bacterium]|nr:complement resistance protein TraT [Gammaproteobacteria bacterium]